MNVLRQAQDDIAGLAFIVALVLVFSAKMKKHPPLFVSPQTTMPACLWGHRHGVEGCRYTVCKAFSRILRHFDKLVQAKLRVKAAR
jgi:hypothetical protein